MFQDKLRWVRKLVRGWLGPGPSKRPRRRTCRFRPGLEALEGRTVPSQLLWTDATGDGLAGTAGNWRDLVTHAGAVPGPGDIALFAPALGGSNAGCAVNVNLSVARVVMEPSYTATLAVAAGETLASASDFAQYGTLSLAGGAAVTVQGNVYVNGTVTTTGGAAGAATVSTTASFYINAGAAVSATTSPPGGPSLTLSAGAFDDAGTITVGTGGALVGSLTVSGNFVEDPRGTISVLSGSTLTFATGGNSSALADLKGTLALVSTPAGIATVSNAQPLWIDGGTLTATGGANPAPADTITGDVSVFNSGTITIGTTTAASTLSLTGGSLTVGAQAPGLSATGGTLNVNAGSLLTFSAAAGVTSTFVVKGGPAPAVVNLYGATISMDAARVAFMDLEGGTLDSFGSSAGGADAITGSLNNAGTVQFGGALHALTVSANYTQTTTGTLDMRLGNGGASDTLPITGSASLAGALDLSAQGSLTPQTWTPITYASHTGDFEPVVFPPDGGTWTEVAAGGGVIVTKVN